MTKKDLNYIASVEKAIAEKYGMCQRIIYRKKAKEPLHTCPICGSFPKKSMDDVCLLKFDCCNTCYIQYIEGREERWQKGWRPNLKEENE